MAKNRIQFQKGMSLSDFMARYGTEDNCRKALFHFRWPDGFVCPQCGNNTHCELKTRQVIQCHRCHHQTSLTAGTIFHSTKLPLTKWFLAMYLLTQSKNGISALELSRQIGASYNATWRVKHKLMQVMLERGSIKRLSGRVQIDDSYLGGKRVSGKRGRGAKNKTPFVAAVETREEKPRRIKLSKVKGFRLDEIERWSRHHLEPGSHVVSDGLNCFSAIAKAGCKHEFHVVGGGKRAVEHPAFNWVNTLLGNVKNSLRGTYHALRVKHIPRYLAEFQYRFNRRFDLESMVPRLAYIAVRTPPMPARLLTLAEKEW
jgi:ribosomal protein L37AE/L43A